MMNDLLEKTRAVFEQDDFEEEDVQFSREAEGTDGASIFKQVHEMLLRKGFVYNEDTNEYRMWFDKYKLIVKILPKDEAVEIQVRKVTLDNFTNRYSIWVRNISEVDKLEGGINTLLRGGTVDETYPIPLAAKFIIADAANCAYDQLGRDLLDAVGRDSVDDPREAARLMMDHVYRFVEEAGVKDYWDALTFDDKEELLSDVFRHGLR